MKNNKPTAKSTVVTYLKGSVRYTHTFSENLTGSEAERRMILDLRVGRSDILKIEHV